MPDWHQYLTDAEFLEARARIERVASDKGYIRSLMNRAKQRKHRDANRAKSNN